MDYDKRKDSFEVSGWGVLQTSCWYFKITAILLLVEYKKGLLEDNVLACDVKLR